MQELPGKLQDIQQLVAHLFPSLKDTMNSQVPASKWSGVAAGKRTQTHSQRRLWLNEGFSQWTQSRGLWLLWPALLHLATRPGRLSGFPLSPGPRCDTRPSSSGTHRSEGMSAEHMEINRVDVVFKSTICSSFLTEQVYFEYRALICSPCKTGNLLPVSNFSWMTSIFTLVNIWVNQCLSKRSAIHMRICMRFDSINLFWLFTFQLLRCIPSFVQK